jgi:uncharacterized protein (TIGR02466 family)
MIIFSNYLHEAHNQDLADYLLTISRSILKKVPDSKSYRNGKNTFFHQQIYQNDQNLKPLYNFIIDNSFDYLNAIELDTKKYTTKITALWFSEMYKNGLHEVHAHGTQDDISGTFYVYLEEGSSNITFYRHDFLYNSFSQLQVKNYNSHNSTEWTITSKKGMLLMWQSTLPHSVKQNGSNSRIAISFNMKIIEK